MLFREVGIAFSAMCLSAIVLAQTAAPAFDVVSIRRVSKPDSPVLRTVDFTPVLAHGGYRDTFTNSEELISFAYNIHDPERHLSGLPKLTNGVAFSVSAKASPDFPVLAPEENREQVRLMVRTMLNDRFHLQLHTEKRPEKVFKLELAKGGLKLKEVDPPVPPEQEGYTFGAGARLLAKKTTMARLALALTVMTGRTVVDETGLTGYYTFDIKWTVDSPSAANRPGGLEFATADFNGPLISVLADQFGLRLTSGTVTNDFVIVDHIDLPTEN